MTDFSRLAARYDAGLLGRVSRPFYAAVEAVAESYLTPGARVLDVGCGTGALLTRLVTKYDVIGTGIDPSPQMAEIARHAHPGLRILTGEAEALPFPDSSFDVVLACLSYHHFANTRAFISEAKRVLVPGGELFIAEPALPQFINFALRLSSRIIHHSEVFQTPSALAEQITAFGMAAQVAYHQGLITVVAAAK